MSFLSSGADLDVVVIGDGDLVAGSCVVKKTELGCMN